MVLHYFHRNAKTFNADLSRYLQACQAICSVTDSFNIHGALITCKKISMSASVATARYVGDA